LALTNEKDKLNLSVLQSAPYKAAKIIGFQFHFDFTSVFGKDSSSPPTGEIY
jgi:hypothetical protein